MELFTERLILRDFKADDWPAVLAYQTDPLYLRYYPWTGRTLQEVKEFVQMFLDQQADTPRLKFQLAVTLQSNQALIGNCGVRMDTVAARQGSIGYELAPVHWGLGYATEAAQTMLAYGFTELGLHRIWAATVPENRGSRRVLEKLGMQLEGRLCEVEYYKGRWWDTLIYAILEDVWRNRQTSGSLRS